MKQNPDVLVTEHNLYWHQEKQILKQYEHLESLITTDLRVKILAWV